VTTGFQLQIFQLLFGILIIMHRTE